MKKNILIGLVVLASGGLLIACGGGSSNEPEMINGIVVPLDPGEAGKETLAGIDSNKNGLRDDIERLIAEKFGNDPAKFNKAIDFTKKVQPLFNPISAGEGQVEDYTKELECANLEDLEIYSVIEQSFINTKDRVQNYNEIAIGSGGGEIGGSNCD